MRSLKVARRRTERSTSGFARRPKTRRRLSGWLSKITMRRISLWAPFVDSSQPVCLMTKIFLVGRRCPSGDDVWAKFGWRSMTGLTSGVGNTMTRLRKPVLFMPHGKTGHHIAAMAHAWDFIVLRQRRSQPPLLGERRSLNGRARTRAEVAPGSEAELKRPSLRR